MEQLNKKSLCRWKSSRGMSLVELLIALGLLSGLVVVDLKRQQIAQEAARRHLASESLGNVENQLRGWIRQRGTIAYSFGDRIPGGQTTVSGDQVNRVRVFDAPPSVFARELETAVGDNDAIVSIRVVDAFTVGSVLQDGDTNLADDADNLANYDGLAIAADAASSEVLSQFEFQEPNPLDSANPTRIKLIGRVENGEVRSLDGAGQVYIRSMWLQEFQEYTSEGNIKSGTANLKVSTWNFNNPTGNPSLNCVANNNCERKVFTLPVELEMDSTNRQVLRGQFGLGCDDFQDVRIDETVNCDENQFFKVARWLDSSGSDGTDPSNYSTGAYRGRCCRFIQ